MPVKRTGKTAPARGAAPDAASAVAAAALVAALAASQLPVDLRAEASFDAPKRLATLVAIAVAAAAAFAFAPRRVGARALWRSAGRAERAALLLAAGALAGAAVSALLSPRRSVALDTFRPLAIFALLLPLGASRAAAYHGRLLLGVFVGLTAANAALSVLQGRQILRPFGLEARGTRDLTGALVGNVGYLSLAVSLAAVAALGIALSSRRLGLVLPAAAAVVLFLADLVVNQNLTSLSALVLGSATLLFARFGRRAVAPALLAVLLVALAFASYRPARVRGAEALQALRARDPDRLLTYRFGPWAAALEMFRQRPLLGFGPGTFEAEFVPHRLQAEIRARRRFVNPLVTSSYGEAHSEPLQALAEGGLAGVAAIAAGLILIGRLAKTAGTGGASPEASLVLALVVAGAVACLTWFPLQRPATSVPLLLAAGRGWRMAAESRNAADDGERRR